MFRACCGNRFPLPNGRLKNQKRMLWRGEMFFLDGQCSDDEYSSDTSFITPIRVVTYIKENDFCLRVIQKRKTIYMFFFTCMQNKCLNTIRQYVMVNHGECFLPRADSLFRNCSLYLLLRQMLLSYTGLAHAKRRGVLLLL